ncbi:hypothetical protein Tco_0543109 [Tanacetum coccineum]
MDNRWKQPITQEITVLVKILLTPLAIKSRENANDFENALKEELFEDLENKEKALKEQNDSLIAELNHKTLEINDPKAQLQDKTIANVEMRKSWNKMKGKGVDTSFGKPSILEKPPLQTIRNQPKKDAQSHKTTKRFIPIENKSDSKNLGRQIPIGQRFPPNKSSAVYVKTTPLRSDLTWKPTGRIFTYVGLRWIPTKKSVETCNNTNDSVLPLGKETCTPDTDTIICANSYSLSAGTSMASEPISTNGSTNVSSFGVSSWHGARVGVRTYLLDGAIDGGEANGIIRDPNEATLIYQWLGMKKDIASYGSKYLAYSKVEVEYPGSLGLLLQPELPE